MRQCRSWVLLIALSLATTVFADGATIPRGNDPKLIDAPTLPAMGDLEARARTLLQAIANDDPTLAMGLFLPREAFAQIKAVSAPDPLYDRLVRAYARDIHALHARLPGLDQAQLVRVELSRRRAFVRVREEANRLPYWAQRHNTLVYSSHGREHRFELRVLIAWDDRWYLTHLSEFH